MLARAGLPRRGRTPPPPNGGGALASLVWMSSSPGSDSLGYTVNGRFRAILMTMLCGTALCGTALAVSGCATQTPSQAAETNPPGAVPDNASYVVGAGDSLSVFVYRAPELSVPDLPVRPDGRISVPLIEDIVAAGKTPTQLARAIESRLKKYVKDPSVTVIVRGFVGPLDRQVKVIGEATEPVALPYRDHMTVLDVMIATKGLTKFAAG